VVRAAGGAPPTVSQPVTAKPKSQKAKTRAVTKKTKRARP
jgi:hypothetical protein